jgi:hypothetical protein
MSVLRIDIQGNPKSIPYRSFLTVANNSLAILDDLDAAFSHRRYGHGALQWYMKCAKSLVCQQSSFSIRFGTRSARD